jgi:hypothetical protein
MRKLIFAAVAALGVAAVPVLSWAAEPIATTDGEAAGLSLQVHELKVSNGTVMLKFSIANDGNAAFDPDTLADHSVDKADYHSVSGIYLIDAANKKKYLVIYDTGHLCICSRETHNIEAKTGANLWARFPAPPDSVTKIGIVVPHFVPMDDVPLSR